MDINTYDTYDIGIGEHTDWMSARPSLNVCLTWNPAAVAHQTVKTATMAYRKRVDERAKTEAEIQ